MGKTNYNQRHRVLEEWIVEAIIMDMPQDQIIKVESDFFQKERLIRRFEEEADNFRGLGREEESDQALDEAHKVHEEIVSSLQIKKFAA